MCIFSRDILRRSVRTNIFLCYDLFYQTWLSPFAGQNRLKGGNSASNWKRQKLQRDRQKNPKADIEIYRAKQCEDTYFRSQQLHLR